MPIARKYKVAVINWGLVAGKTQTYLPWDSWQHPYTDREPAIWFHEVFRMDGTPYRPEETEFIKRMTGKKMSTSRSLPPRHPGDNRLMGLFEDSGPGIISETSQFGTNEFIEWCS
jgi:hypothetical protein